MLVDEALSLLAPRARQKNLRLRCELDARLKPAWLTGDPGRIRQVVLNLVNNAVKFTDQGEVTVAVGWQAEAAGRVRLRLEVRDTGIGIPAATQKALFQPFSQADGSTSRRYGGTGLGLAIVRQLVELMGGEVGLTSEEGRGSNFWFQLELPRGQKPVPVAPASVVPSRPHSGVASPTLRVLVAEDNPANQLVVQGLVEKMGASIDFAGNGAEALEMLAKQHYDVVLMDCQMPVMDGYTATRQIRAGAVPGINPGIIIIALTAYAMPSDRQKCLDAGMNDYVPKPLRREQLRLAFKRCGVPVVAEANGPAGDAAPENNVLDATQLRQLRELPGRQRPTLLQEVVEVFLRETPAALATLRGLVEQRDSAGTVMLAHRLAGSCANLGGEPMRQTAHAVEHAAEAGDWAAMPEMLMSLDREWRRMQKALQNLTMPSSP